MSTGTLRAAALDAAYQAALADRAGQVAAYIPELARVDPELFGLAICSPDGELLVLGDGDVEFTLQSVSKPFVYAGALARLGLDTVHERVGVEPTGDAFDSIIRLEQATHRPHNPMINAGAIAITGLLVEHGVGIDDLLELLGRFAGRPLAVDLPTYLSERSTGHRNRAIAYLLRHFGLLRAPVDTVLDLYFQQCSIAVTCRDLAVMAATLAGQGRHPQTGERVLPAELVRPVLTVMYTAGLYDESGRFAFEVGLPAKSGVSGDILAVAPGRLGLAAVAPRLDERGNSVRGQVAMRHLSRALGLHLFDHPPAARRAPTPRATLEQALADALDFARSQPAGGEVAAYIPHLAKVDPQLLAVALCTVEGECLAVGDHAAAFTLQSAANPFTYAAVVEAVGSEVVHRAIGVEPSGNPFHEIVFDHQAVAEDGSRRNRPPNPLGNAGAIALCGMMPGRDATARLLRLLEVFGCVAGGRLTVDAGVLQAEKAAGDRNRAIASLLRNFGWIADEEAALELYWQQCSLRADTRTLARLGATLAAGGFAPGAQADKTRVFAATTVRDTLSLMSTCGLHDESGHFAFDVGLPAKSGISGCLLAIVPGFAAIAAYAPPVNHAGTSPRARAAVRHLAQTLHLGIFG